MLLTRSPRYIGLKGRTWPISGDKRQLWAFEDANATLGTPATLHGYPIYVNNDMSDVASDGSFGGSYSSVLAFGDWKRFVVRQAENNSPYLYRYPVPAKDGSAVILFRRSDSKLLVPEAIAKLTVGTS
ncbi:MAG: phage major capsid protein [Acidobacteria bacterium]|nr:MAG: phage major capsid protein [Acidobacteriota bacterium]